MAVKERKKEMSNEIRKKLSPKEIEEKQQELSVQKIAIAVEKNIPTRGRIMISGNTTFVLFFDHAGSPLEKLTFASLLSFIEELNTKIEKITGYTANEISK